MTCKCLKIDHRHDVDYGGPASSGFPFQDHLFYVLVKNHAPQTTMAVSWLPSSSALVGPHFNILVILAVGYL